MISVITVCFNSEKTIEQTLNSMLKQSLQEFEYIIIDGASTDKTLQILNQYCPLFGGKMKIISEPDNGIYDAMNKGIRCASGELIGLLNSDDWYENNTLELAAASYTGHKYEVVYGMERIYKNDKLLQIVFKNHEFLEEDMIMHPTCFVTKDTYADFGAFDLRYKSSADYDFMLRLHMSGKVVFTPVYQIMANFRLGGGIFDRCGSA